MKTKSPFSLAALVVLSQVIVLGPVPARAQDLPPDAAGAGPLPSPTRLVELALEGRGELELTEEQVGRLDAFRTGSLDRTAGAREVIAAWREERVAEREALADSVGLSPRERRRMLGAAAGPTPEVREALSVVRDEGEAAVEELRATLTVNQMSALREIARDEFPRLAGGGPDRMRGMAPGFGPRSGPGFGQGFGPRGTPRLGQGFGPRGTPRQGMRSRNGPGFGPRFGPDDFPRRFRR